MCHCAVWNIEGWRALNSSACKEDRALHLQTSAYHTVGRGKKHTVKERCEQVTLGIYTGTLSLFQVWLPNQSIANHPLKVWEKHPACWAPYQASSTRTHILIPW